MCGIIGQINLTQPINEAEFLAMRDTLIHRGPDDAGHWTNASHTVALGHRRLAFLDLGPEGRQPLSSPDGRFHLTFNGEIYNYLELRAELEATGHQFRTQTDTEVILNGYAAWGTKVLTRLKGMFAFGLWDAARNRLFLARDRFGIKPLYWYAGPESFIFASELKGILAHPPLPQKLNTAAMWDFFTYRYIPSPRTIWKNIQKLPPAHYLLFTPGQEPHLEEYWRLTPGTKSADREVLIGEIDRLLEQSVAEHIRSDVPIGSFLSGGYDSSALVYYLHRLKYPTATFSIGFTGWDESEHQYADIVAQQFATDHHHELLHAGHLELVKELVHFYDEPIADISIIPTYRVSGLARTRVKAVLSGEGADELFAGYTWQQAFPDQFARQSSLRRWREKRGWETPFGREFYAEAMAMGRFRTRELFSLFAPAHRPPVLHDADWFYQQHHRPELNPLRQMQYLDVKTFMGELVLTKVDRASMAHSLEVRVPFLDHELFEYLFSIDEQVWYAQNQTKYPLYRVLQKHLPEKILRRRKQGFVGPDRYYQDIGRYNALVTDGALVEAGILNRRYLKKLVADRDHWRLWKVMVFELWYRKWQ